MVYLKTEDIYLEIAKDIEIRFDTSNHEYKNYYSKGKTKKKWINKIQIRRKYTDRAYRSETKDK